MTYIYLDVFFNYVREGVERGPRLDDNVKSEIDAMKRSLQEDGIVLDFAPASVIESVKEHEGVRVMTYSGTFFYGFLKDGLFHEVPGDLSTAAERVPHSGVISIVVDRKRDAIIGIHENLAGHTYGMALFTKSWNTKMIVMLLGFALILFFIVMDAADSFQRIRDEYRTSEQRAVRE